MTNTLYSSTKTLIELIKEKKPEIYSDIVSESKEFVIPDGRVFDHREILNRIANKILKLDDIVPYPTAQSLLTLIPQLFDAVENPSFAQEMTSEGIYPYMDKVLLTRYFVDGLWLESETLVIDDLINQINAYL
jgi:hypothetical protein